MIDRGKNASDGKKTKQHLEMRGYWKLKEEAVDCTLWRTCFGTGYGPDIRRR